MLAKFMIKNYKKIKGEIYTEVINSFTVKIWNTNGHIKKYIM